MSKETTLSLHEAILSAAAFFDIFDSAMRIDELQKYLYRFDENASEDDIRAAIRGLNGKIRLHRGLYCLNGRDEVCEKRGEHQKRTKALLRRVKRYCGLLRYVPFVRFVGLCNTVAFGAPDTRSDIDLFIIVKNDRLFISRLLVSFLFQILGVRRHGRKIAKRFCLSFYVTERGMDLHDIQLSEDDVYLYYWLRTMKPVLGDIEVYKRFLGLNGVEKFYDERMIVAGKLRNSFFEWVLNGSIGNFLEKKLSAWQKRRALEKKSQLDDDSGIVISDDMLKFHNVDRRGEFRDKWAERISACS